MRRPGEIAWRYPLSYSYPVGGGVPGFAGGRKTCCVAKGGETPARLVMRKAMQRRGEGSLQRVVEKSSYRARKCPG